MPKKEITDDQIKAYALKNAVEHEGKAVDKSVLNSLFNEGLDKKDILSVMPRIAVIVSEVNKMGLELQENMLKELEKNVSHRKVKQEGELPELPNAKKGVVMRIAPSVSGPLHLPHAINLSLNYNFVKKYKGKLYVRIEDTNPETVYKPAYKMIEDEAKWLTKNKAKIVIQSDNMKNYYKYAENLIKKNKAYVCTCSAEDFRKLIIKSKACECRNLDVKENMGKWEKMLDKKGFKKGRAVLRFKADLNDKNPAMRDFPLARINTTKHPRVGNKYRVWPLMNLAVTVDDIEMKMTHVIRGKDHKDNAKRQEMMYKVLGKKPPWTGFLGMLNFKGMAFSTRQMKADIQAGKYKGWEDPRLDTVASLRKRGYNPEAFWKLAAHIGLSEVDKVIDKKDFFEILDKFNK